MFTNLKCSFERLRDKVKHFRPVRQSVPAPDLTSRRAYFKCPCKFRNCGSKVRFWNTKVTLGRHSRFFNLAKNAFREKNFSLAVSPKNWPKIGQEKCSDTAANRQIFSGLSRRLCLFNLGRFFGIFELNQLHFLRFRSR